MFKVKRGHWLGLFLQGCSTAGRTFVEKVLLKRNLIPFGLTAMADHHAERRVSCIPDQMFSIARGAPADNARSTDPPSGPVWIAIMGVQEHALPAKSGDCPTGWPSRS